MAIPRDTNAWDEIRNELAAMTRRAEEAEADYRRAMEGVNKLVALAKKADEELAAVKQENLNLRERLAALHELGVMR